MKFISDLKDKIKLFIGPKYIKDLVRYEFDSQRYIIFNERPVEYAKVFNILTEYCPENILDVGTGLTALPHLMRNCGFFVTAIDNIKNYWENDLINRHYYVINDDITDSKLDKKFDLITCISTLEHIVNYMEAIKNMSGLLKNEGLLLLSFPYNENEYCENVYKLEDSKAPKNLPFSTQAFSRKQIDKWQNLFKFKIIEQEYWQFWTGKYWTQGERTTLPVKVLKNEKHQLTTLLLKKCM